jgi:hypothetical protein
MEASSITGGSGEPLVRGLPFTSANLAQCLPIPTFRDCTAITTLAAQQMLNGFVEVNSTYIFLQYMQMGTAGLASATGLTWKSGGGRICLSLTYFAA